MNFWKRQFEYLFLAPKWLLALFFIIIGVLIGSLVSGTQAGILNDNFEAYSTGALTGQGAWGTDPDFVVVDTFSHTGSKSVYIVNKDEISSIYSLGSEKTTGIQTWYFNTDGTHTGTSCKVSFGVGSGADNLSNFGIYYNTGTTKWDLYYQDGITPYSLVVVSADVSLGSWHSIQAEFDEPNWRYRIKLDNDDWTGWISFFDYYNPALYDYVNKVWLGNQRTKAWYDDLGGEIETYAYIEGLSPASGTSILDTDSTITIGYYFIDPDIYDGILFNFRQDRTGIIGDSYNLEEIDGSGSDTLELPLSIFNIDQNGKWYLEGLAYYSHLDIEGGMFLTTRGYIEEFTENLVIDDYYLLFNDDELPEFYTFTDADDWYSANIVRFDSPTDFFIAFVGLMTPIFENIADFGIRIQEMFDTTQSYDRGFALGEIFPIARGYIEKIDMFFGGFPLATFFMYIILVMISIFVIRLVMKFIPFFG